MALGAGTGNGWRTDCWGEEVKKQRRHGKVETIPTDVQVVPHVHRSDRVGRQGGRCEALAEWPGMAGSWQVTAV